MALDIAIDPSLLSLDMESGTFEQLMWDDGNTYDMFDPVCQTLEVFTGGTVGTRASNTQDPLVGETTEDSKIPYMLETPPSHIYPGMTQPPLDAKSTTTSRFNDVPEAFVNLLFKTYFDACQSTIRLFDDMDGFLRLTKQPSAEMATLRYAVIAHAVPACPQFSAWAATHMQVAGATSGHDYAGHFYRLAGLALSNCDPDHRAHRASLRALQATVLIGLYELQHAQFGRAWLSASRADWLTETMHLRTLDGDDGARADGSSTELLDEARRAQWATSALTGALMKGGRMVGSAEDEEEITTWLPPPQSLLARNRSSHVGVRIEDIFRNAAPRPLSVEEALWATHMLTRRIVIHVRDTKTTTGRQPYSFWTNQHQLEQTLRYLRSFVQAEMDAKPGSGQETMLDLYTKAWDVVLLEAKLKKKATTHSSSHARSADQDRAGERVVLQRTLELAGAMQTCVLPIDAVSAITLSWILYAALQSLLRCKRRQSASAHDSSADSNDGGNNSSGRSSSSSLLLLDNVACDGGAFGQTDSFTVNNALIMDASDALQSMLAQLGHDNPIAGFFLGQLEVEKSSSDIDLGKYLVGLADFAAS
ncbi:hypothetical protein QQZ08_011403 [Neonectria magnoliae]|uniref:Transcription factor domain-containing protein n=1 Tax=Neonectria magnoliae TaxID=2732573 RepID=A0ABR1HBT7_9HYPO